ncbi:MAG: glycosyltransferase, partial [Acidimicrobiia bacterium]|nr:glycosyltransferase [Acidimicrobiia bacterium]
HSVTVVAASADGTARVEDDQGVRVIRLQSRSNPFWSDGALPVVSQTELRQIIREADPDIVHSHETALLSLQLLRLGLDREVPLVATCHYLPRFVAQYVGWDGRLDGLAESIVWEYAIRLLNQFDHVVFPSKTQATAFTEEGLVVPFTVISNGVDTDRYRPGLHGVEGVEARYRLPEGRRMLFVSRLAKDKRVDVLLNSLLHLRQANTHLVLVGTGDDEPRLKAITGNLALEGRVHFLGFVPEEDLPSVYRACDLFAIASECEVQSIPTLQAAATGLPIVAVDAAALPELVNDDVNGFLVAPADHRAIARAVEMILDDSGRAAAMGRASLETSRAHGDAATVDAHELLYRTVIAGYERPRETWSLERPTGRWSRLLSTSGTQRNQPPDV